MKANGLITTVRASARTAATREAAYATLANPSTHLVWGGEGTGDAKFRLLTMDYAGGEAVTGTRFSSTGLIPMGIFHDETAVTDATPATRFAFITESVLERPRREAWRGWFDHRYTLTVEDGHVVISYECDLHAGNYVPYWWRLPMRPMTRFVVGRRMTSSLRSLARIAERSAQAAATATPLSEAAAG